MIEFTSTVSSSSKNKYQNPYVMGWMCPPKIHTLKSYPTQYPRMWLYFRHRVFKEVIQLKWGIRVGPNLIWLVSLWEMWTQSGSGKATWRPKEKTDTYKPRGGLGRSEPCQHLDLELPVPKMWENVFLLFKPHRLCSFAMAAQANEFISVWLQSPPWLVGSF